MALFKIWSAVWGIVRMFSLGASDLWRAVRESRSIRSQNRVILTMRRIVPAGREETRSHALTKDYDKEPTEDKKPEEWDV